MKKTKLTHRGASVGDMRHRVILHERSIRAPMFEEVDFTEYFDGIECWAAIKTLRGKTVFDGVSQDVSATHELTIRYDYSVTSEMFVQVEDGRRFKILQVDDYEERHEYMTLLCTDRGFDEAAKA